MRSVQQQRLCCSFRPATAHFQLFLIGATPAVRRGQLTSLSVNIQQHPFLGCLFHVLLSTSSGCPERAMPADAARLFHSLLGCGELAGLTRTLPHSGIHFFFFQRAQAVCQREGLRPPLLDTALCSLVTQGPCASFKLQSGHFMAEDVREGQMARGGLPGLGGGGYCQPDTGRWSPSLPGQPDQPH